jgi:hypothetical protein
VSFEQLFNWSVELLPKWSHMAFPSKSLYELMATVENRDHVPEPERLKALVALGKMIQKEDCPVVGITCLIDCIQHDRSVSIVSESIQILNRVKTEDATMVIIDVLLQTHVALYENPSDEFLESDANLQLRRKAASALGKLGDNRAIIPLMSILSNKTENYRLRLSVAESLGYLGDGYAVKPLIEILSDDREKSVYLKESVAKALGMLGDIRAIEPLIDILESKKGIRDKFSFLKEQIIEALGRIGRPCRKASDTLLEALSDEAPSIRLAAVEALTILGSPSCIPALQQCIYDVDDLVAKEALHAIYVLGGESAIQEIMLLENLPLFLRAESKHYLDP